MSLSVDKSKKYDRQLRLWGDNGQVMLENSHVCLIGCDAVGSEIMKNLILPGIGKVTIIDDTIVSSEDYTNNFFISHDNTIGKSRAEVASKLLMELNDEVIVNYLDESVESIMTQNPAYFTKFNIVIACGLNNKDLLSLDRILYPDNIPLIVCHSVGMFASARVIVQEHHVFDSRPDNMKVDLRLRYPPTEFIRFSQEQDFEKMSKKDISHCPWLIVLHKYCEIYKKKYNTWPSTYRDKITLKSMIREDEVRIRTEKIAQCKTGDSEPNNDVIESFEEACKSISTALDDDFIPDDYTRAISENRSDYISHIPPNVAKLLVDTRCTNLRCDSRPFWVLVRALRNFIYTNDQHNLPLRGDIPDMVSDTERYVRLQRIYREVAQSHVAELQMHVTQLCQNYQIQKTEELSDANIAKFAKNCRHICCISTLSLERELKTSPIYADELVNNPDSSDELLWYLVLRASVNFLTTEGRYPGQQKQDPGMDVRYLRNILNQDHLANSPKCKGLAVREDFLQEMCRYRGIQLHSICAFIGGVVAQQTIKLLTGQYIPISQPLLYNGITQTTYNVDL